MLPVNSVSTDAVPQRDRFAYWVEAVSRQHTGMTVEATPDQRRNFSARMAAVRHAGVASMEFERSAAIAHRSRADIARFSSDNLLIYSAPSPSWFHAHGGDEFLAPAGSLVIGFADVPFSHANVDGLRLACVLASLPAALIGPPRRGHAHRLPRVVLAHEGLGALLSDFFAAWRRNLTMLEGESFAAAAHTLAQLAALAHGSAAASEVDREAVAAARRAAAERYIIRNLHRADLSPTQVAGAVGVSVRRLHGLFEPTGVSVSRRIIASRLDAARRLLAGEERLSVTEIAYRCGFDSLATFYRAFKTGVGMTASEYREAARQTRG